MWKVLTVLLALCTGASAADLTVAQQKQLFQRTPCTLASCSGPYVGVSLIGSGTNADILGGGLGNSIFANGGIFSFDAGYQFWNGNFFFAGEVFAGYEALGSAVIIGPSPNDKWMYGGVVKLGTPLSNLFGNGTQATAPSQTPQGPITIPTALANSLMSPYVQFGVVRRWWGSGWATGAGATFIVAPGWNADLNYMYVKYRDDAVSPFQVQKFDNLVKFGMHYKF